MFRDVEDYQYLLPPELFRVHDLEELELLAHLILSKNIFYWKMCFLPTLI
jgi:hypothetical protein